MTRTGKFYRKNEREVMEMLGLQPTPNSGSGWIVKEDGMSDNLICQLKSTDATSIKINKTDLDKLNYNAHVAYKLPIFAIQFLQSDEVFLVVKPDDIEDVAKYIVTREYQSSNEFLGIDETEEQAYITSAPTHKVKSSANARNKFMRDYNKKFEKESKSAK